MYNPIIIVTVFGIMTVSILSLLQQRVAALSLEESFGMSTVAVTGRNVYVAWHTNDTGNNNEVVFFRASHDGGKTFGDKVYLSHTTGSNSTRIEIDSDGDIVSVLW
jgi:hypothetical protein